MTTSFVQQTGVGSPATASGEPYSMRRWVFSDALGRYDIDLGDSQVQCVRTDQLRMPVDLELDYGVNRGTSALRELVARRYGPTGRPEQVVVTHGAQEALYLLYATLLRPGDRMLTFRPGWQQSWEAPAKLGAEVVAAELTADFEIDLDEVARVAAGGLRLITLNTPHNPSGRRLPEHVLATLFEIADRAGAYLVVDEEYELELSRSIALRHPRAISVCSLSKAAGLPGLRVGWMYGESAVVDACAEYKFQISVANSVLCEALAVQALTDWDHYVQTYDRLTHGGLALLREFTARHPARLRMIEPEGTPFAWFTLLGGGSAMRLAREILDERVLVMPGEVLGRPGGFRISFAREPDVLAEGLSRVEHVLSKSLTE